MDKELRFMTLIKGKRNNVSCQGGDTWLMQALVVCDFSKTKPNWTDGVVMVVCLLLGNAALHAFLLQAMGSVLFCIFFFSLEATKGCWGYFWLLWSPKGNSIVLENEHKCIPVMLWAIHAVFFFFLVGLLAGAAFNPFLFAENATVRQ